MTAILTIQNLPDELHSWLKEQAAINHSSIDNEVIVLLDSLRTGRAAKPRASLEKINEIVARCAALPDLDARSPDEIIGYDEFGIPR